MRLLNTETENIEEFFGEKIPLQYAVLSHRWGDEEVSLQDWLARSSRPDVRAREGFRKIQLCCEQAKKDGIEWAWIDTCCIDKSSSQELSEAINSMFHWYGNSSVCYVHLFDYDSDTFDDTRLGDCEWFFRGWTLQELIAPQKVNFYNNNWEYFAAKSDPHMCQAISEITKIDAEFLLGSDLELASIAKRMSWASKRKTTRPEDTAYCLLGIFDINMPLLYGEGTKAFKRLQEEIMKLFPEDHSLYAWGTPVDKCSIEVSIEKSMRVSEEKVTNQVASPEPLGGLLAKSPQDFQFSRNYSPVPWAGHFYTTLWRNTAAAASYPTAVGKGVRIELPYNFQPLFYYQFSEQSVSQIRYGCYAVLLCQDDTDEHVTPYIPLVRWGSGYYARSGELYLRRQAQSTHNPLLGIFDLKSTITIAPERKPQLQSGNVILRSVLDLRAFS
ncbi:heterokaryon incompatibility protein-domain-containing protein [Hypoxylon crocopeplum]|nr:heterokaryon incompatibility protein-domain-containing protein [Hypoxylon crocopeplum]